MPFTISEKTIGIAGSSGKMWITKDENGNEYDIICHMNIPGHWIFKTEKAIERDLLGFYDPYSPRGKNDYINLEYGLDSPCNITYWSCSKQEIGWYGLSTDIDQIQEDYKEMGKYLSSDEAKAQFDILYEGQAPEEEATHVPADASLSDEERREKNRKARARAKKRKTASKDGPVPVGMVYK